MIYDLKRLSVEHLTIEAKHISPSLCPIHPGKFLFVVETQTFCVAGTKNVGTLTFLPCEYSYDVLH